MSETIEDLVLRLAKERGAGKTICPTEAAKAAAEQRGEENWNARLPAVKAAAVRLAKRGGVAIYRKGKPVDPESFKGVYRIGLPPAAETAQDDAPEAEAVIPAEAEGEEPASSSE
ncbi:DUF3253 domain-containing protein [Chelatococcus sambhunathii]|uniref:DUF3253 domain-containing protein n=1 Tax=Chelatococcus sambhunathii TaxID=363953 RepID=A0ABU1DB02_9HYPH|nr:DUF3253 domain-containing protein [Chelatococcus sambhunathii]MDR4305288.1 DUF3253 domain-containing protein [Chelatococcus sambhunathii]